MSAELELVVRREYAIFTPSYHVTVAKTGPLHVIESFDVQTREGLAADLMANLLAIKAKADAVLSLDKAVESAAILDDVVAEVER